MKNIISLVRDRSAKGWRASVIPVLFWPVVGLVITGVAWFFLLKSLEHEKNLAKRAGQEVAAKTAFAQATQARKNLLMIDQVLFLVRIHVTTFSSKDQLTQFVTLLAPAGGALDIDIYDANGRWESSSRAGAGVQESAVNVSQEAFFSQQVKSDGDTLFIGTPKKITGSNRELIRFSRKLFKSGMLAGIVSVELATSSLLLDGSSALLGNTGFIVGLQRGNATESLPLSDGRPPSAELIRQLPDVYSSDHGSMMWAPRNQKTWNYFLAWQKVVDFPIVVVTGVAQDRVMSRYDERENATIQTAIGATFAMLAFVIAAAAVTAKLEAQRHGLRLEQAAYRAATEQGSEGFFIVRPLCDHKDIVDYLAIDCNERGARFFSRSRDSVIGQTLSSFQSLLPLDFVMTKFSEAMESGIAEFTLRIIQDGRERPLFLSATTIRIDGVLAITLRDVTLEKIHLSSLERQTKEDTLTGLPNRAWLTETLPNMVAGAKQSSLMLAVLFVDLDGFKSVNDTFGHAAGDELLKIVSQRLTVAVRPKDYVTRIGGDEFIIVLEELTSSREAGAVAERIVAAFSAPFAVTSGLAKVGTSIGISLFPSDAVDAETLMRHADMAMYAVKTTGKNRYQYFDSALFVEMLRKVQLERDLRIAIAERQFVMYYQPRVDVVTGEVFSMEALVRWIHPEKGLLAPDQFIPVAEETGLILELGELIIDMVCEQLSAWSKCPSPVVPVSINVSSRQFNEVDIYSCISDALARHGVVPYYVEVELTESTMVKDPVKASACIHSLHSLGVRLLVDDFGTGYSSLAMLQDLDFDILKVDKSFTRRLGVDHQGEIFFGAIITMAHALGMRVIAEGVESFQQMEILTRLQCDEVQGFYFYAPTEGSAVQSAAWDS